MIASRLALGTLVVLALFATGASGGMISESADALPLWQGRVNIDGSFGTLNVNADVDYAVFAPGDSFQNFLNDYNINYTDPSGGTEYIYAYQIDENNGSNPGVVSFTVGLDGDEPVSGPYAIPGTGDQSPSAMDFPGTSAKWDFGGLLTTGMTSEILLYSSPWGPERDWGTISAGIASGLSNEIPSPVPEPGTTVLLGLAVAVLSLFAKRRRIC